MVEVTTNVPKCQSSSKGEKAPSLVKELETAKILQELSQRNGVGKILDKRKFSGRNVLVVSPTPSSDGMTSKISTKKRGICDIDIAPDGFHPPPSSSFNYNNQGSIEISSQTFKLPFLLCPDDDELSSSTSITDTNDSRSELSSTLSLKEGGSLSLGRVLIKPLMPPPQMCHFNNFSNPIDPLKISTSLPTQQGACSDTFTSQSSEKLAYSSETAKKSNQFAPNSPLMLMNLVLNNDKHSVQNEIPMCYPLTPAQWQQPTNMAFADQMSSSSTYSFPKLLCPQHIVTPSSTPYPTTDTHQEITHNSKTTRKRKICRMDTCESLAAKRTPYCPRHAGQRRCEFTECSKFAQGKTRFCIAHGGGRRCLVPNCSRGARDQKYCAAHGGGRRCRFLECTKLAVGGGFTCTAHGGGRRCDFSECTKSAQSSSNYCVRHGGGRKCNFQGCDKVARGKTSNGMCMSHSNQITSSQTIL